MERKLRLKIDLAPPSKSIETSDGRPFGSPVLTKTDIEPIKNPVTGEEHRARIVLPGDFGLKEAEMVNTCIAASTQTNGWHLNLRTAVAN